MMTTQSNRSSSHCCLGDIDHLDRELL
jgi:hypothetical protein